MDLIHKYKFVIRSIVQWMGNGRRGTAGVLAVSLVEEVNGRGDENALILPHNMEDTNVKATMCRRTFATVIHVQFMVTGALGLPGVLAAEPATVDR